ncbi:MAG: hypothetical protein ABI834_05625, partial [Ginsengibacter sp.]
EPLELITTPFLYRVTFAAEDESINRPVVFGDKISWLKPNHSQSSPSSELMDHLLYGTAPSVQPIS